MGVYMILSMTGCIGLAIFCFANGLIFGGLLALVGLIPGPGTLPLLATATILFVNGFHLTALIPPLIIANNIRVALQAAGPDS